MADYCVSSILPKLLLDPTPPTYVYSAADAAKFTTYTVLFRNGSCFETRNLPCQTIVDSSLVSVRRVFSFFFFFFFYITLRIYTIEVQIPEAYKRTIHPALKFYSRKISRDYQRSREGKKKERKKSQQSASRGSPGISDSRPTTEPRFEDPRKLVERPPPPPMRRTKVARTVASKHA